MLSDLKLPPSLDGMLFLAESRRNPPMLRSHRHAELELNLVVRGHITLLVDGQRFVLRRRSLLWLFPAQEHQLIDRSDDAQYHVAVFTPRLIADACTGADYGELRRDTAAGGAFLRCELPAASCDLLAGLMDDLCADGLDPDLLNREGGYGVRSAFVFSHPDPGRFNAGLRYLLLTAWRHHRRGSDAAATVRLHPAVQQALAELADDGPLPALAALAARVHVSPAHLSRLFHRDLGVPLARYRNSLRLARFWNARRGEATLLDAVHAAGFGSYAQFYKAFTAAYGRGPRAYLRGEPGSTSGVPHRRA